MLTTDYLLPSKLLFHLKTYDLNPLFPECYTPFTFIKYVIQQILISNNVV